MHADDGHRLRRQLAVNVFQMDHRVPAVRVAFAARMNAGLAANAAARIDEELAVFGSEHGFLNVLLLGLKLPRVLGRLRGFEYADSADLVLGNF